MNEPYTFRAATPSDLANVESFLASAELPTDGVNDWIDNFILAEHAGELVGIAGLEIHGGKALLRSVATAEAWRGKALGRALVEQMLANAAQRGADSVYLLTTTADQYFPRFGFAPLARDAAPESIRASAEFQGACPESAILMGRKLGGE